MSARIQKSGEQVFFYRVNKLGGTSHMGEIKTGEKCGLACLYDNGDLQSQLRAQDKVPFTTQ